MELFDTRFHYDGELPLPGNSGAINRNAGERCLIFAGGTKVVHIGFENTLRLAEACLTKTAKLDCYLRRRDEIKVFIETSPESLPERRGRES